MTYEMSMSGGQATFFRSHRLFAALHRAWPWFNRHVSNIWLIFRFVSGVSPAFPLLRDAVPVLIYLQSVVQSVVEELPYEVPDVGRRVFLFQMAFHIRFFLWVIRR